MTIAIIGGGAAGFFAAINCAERYPDYRIIIFEKSNKVLSKVRISGGGRCNVTHACFDNDRLVDFYPRGKKELRNAFARFSTSDTVAWFEKRGVKLKTENDGRMFPVTDNSGTIIHCLLHEIEKSDVLLKMHHDLKEIHKTEKGSFELHFQNEEFYKCDRVIITTGGSASTENYNKLQKLGHTIVQTVPSLFTFNIPASPLKGLEGISSPTVSVKLSGSNYESIGPVLITHWGISGPAVLRLSSFAARWMNENKYSAKCVLNWFPEMNEETIRNELVMEKQMYPNKNLHR
jgi:predicted Rossmann fold flavoprotein